MRRFFSITLFSGTLLPIQFIPKERRMKKAPKNVIHFKEIIQKLPAFLPKLPHIANGFKNIYLKKNEFNHLSLIFENLAQKHPHYTALHFEETKISYQQLNELANQVAHFLLAQGFKKGDVISLILEDTPNFFIITLATAKIGVISALINPQQSTQDHIHTWLDLKPKAVILDEKYEYLEPKLKKAFNIHQDFYYWVPKKSSNEYAPSGMHHLLKLSQNFPKFNPATSQHIRATDGLFYTYTSGTQSLPQAVLFTHGRWMLSYYSYGHILNLKDKQTLYVPLPLHHATAIVICWSSVLAGKATFAFKKSFNAEQFWQEAKQYNAHAIGYSNEICRQLLEIGRENTPHTVKKMIGYGLKNHQWKTFKQRFGIEEILELYAANEGNIGFNNLLNLDYTVGFSPMSFEVVKYNLDTKHPTRDKNGYCQAVKKGEVGLLLSKITSRMPFEGYVHDELNKGAILRHVFNEHDAYFNSGDLMRKLGYRHVQFIDHIQDTFHWKNQIISTYETEDFLCDCPSIAEANVYGVTVPHHQGRACMATIILSTDHHPAIFDCKKIFEEIKMYLPQHALPIFLRVQLQVQKTTVFKYSKQKLQQQNFDLTLCDDALFVFSKIDNAYEPLTHQIWTKINANEYDFS